MSDKNDTENSDDNESAETEINASLASLDLTIRTEGQEDAEELFYRVWDFMLEDAEEMDEAVRDRLGGLN